MNKNNQNSNWKKSLGFKNMQEKLEKAMNSEINFKCIGKIDINTYVVQAAFMHSGKYLRIDKALNQ